MTAPRARVLILGDSWTKGLPFQRGGGFGVLLLDRDDTELLDLSEVSKTSEDTLLDLPGIAAFRPEFALVNVGGAESMVFPAAAASRLLENVAPQGWRGFEGLHSRALYSSRPRRRVRQRIEQLVKTFTKQLLINLGGGWRRIPVDRLEVVVRELMVPLTEMGCEVAMVGVPFVDAWLSPRSNASFAATNACLARVAAEVDATFVLPDEHLAKWDDYLADHVHLSAGGHHHLAEVLRAELSGASPRWKELLQP